MSPDSSPTSARHGVHGVPFAATHQPLAQGIALVELAGEVDISTAPQFKRELEAAVSEGSTKVVVDLSQVTFIDSTALGVLVGAVRHLHPLGGSMVVVAGGHAVMRPITLTGLDRVFTIVATRDEALAEL